VGDTYLIHYVGINKIPLPRISDNSDDKIRVKERMNYLLGDHPRPALVVSLGALALAPESISDFRKDGIVVYGPEIIDQWHADETILHRKDPPDDRQAQPGIECLRP
jgi:hypothetical protein